MRARAEGASHTPAVLYLAKSTEDMNESLATQREDCRELASTEGWEVIGEFSDEGFSAYSTNRGPGLEAAKRRAIEAAAEFGSTAMIVGQAHDRFCRGAGDAPGAPQSLGELWHELRRRNVHLRTVEDDFDLRDPASVAAIGQRAYMDSRRKSRAVRKGMARRAARGLANGRPPLGYVNIGGLYVVYEPEAAVVRRIFREYLAGRSQQAIGRALAREGIATKHGGRWVQGTIAKVLSNRAYLGALRIGGEWLPARHEPLIDADSFKRAELLREAGRKSQGSGRGRRPSGPLLFRRGFLVCGICGESMVPRSNPAPGYYFCYRNKIEGPGACRMPNPRADVIDEAVLRYFERTWLDVAATREQFAASIAAWRAEAEGYRQAAESEAQRARERYQRVRRDYQDGKLEADDWREQRHDLVAELDAAEAHLDALRARELQVTDQAALRDAEAEVLRTLAALRQADDLDRVRAVLMGTFERFVLTLDPAAGERLERFPDDPGSDLLLGEHGGLSIRPQLRPELVERTANGFEAAQVALPGPVHYAYEGFGT